MTSMETRRQICAAKVRHETAADAHKVVAQLKKRAKRAGRFGVYQCAVCGGFHLTANQHGGRELSKP